MMMKPFVLKETNGSVIDYYDSVDSALIDVVAILRADDLLDYRSSSCFIICSRGKEIVLEVKINNGMFNTVKRIFDRQDR